MKLRPKEEPGFHSVGRQWIEWILLILSMAALAGITVAITLSCVQ